MLDVCQKFTFLLPTDTVDARWSNTATIGGLPALGAVHGRFTFRWAGFARVV